MTKYVTGDERILLINIAHIAHVQEAIEDVEELMGVIVYDDVDYTALRRGWDEFEMENGDILLWPCCEITGCTAGVCIGMSKSLCYPHGIELGEFTVEQFEANRKAKHE